MNEVVYSTAINRYSLAERNSPSKYTRRCINGRITGCGNCVGYCQYEEHPGFLTEELRNKHNCIGKECFHFIPKPAKEKKQVLTVEFPDVSTLIREKTKDYEGMKVMRANCSDSGLWTIHYITISNDYPLNHIAEVIKREFGLMICWNKLNYSFDKCVSLIMSN